MGNPVSQDDEIDIDTSNGPWNRPESTPLLKNTAGGLARAARAQFYADKQLDSERHLHNLAPPLTALYLECQYHTQNWETLVSYLADQPKCSCKDQSTRPIDLIDIYGKWPILLFSSLFWRPWCVSPGWFSSYPFTFCKCCTNAIRLIYDGYLASSPQQPKMAFLVPVIQFHHKLWRTLAILTSGFIDALMDFLDKWSHSPLYSQLCNRKKTDHNLRKPLSHSVNLYQCLLNHQEKLYKEGLNLTSLDIYSEISALAALDL